MYLNYLAPLTSPPVWMSYFFFTSVTQFHPPASSSPTLPIISDYTCSFHTINTCMSPRFNLQSSTPLLPSVTLASQELLELNLYPRTAKSLTNLTFFKLFHDLLHHWMSFKYCQWNVCKRKLLISSTQFLQFLLECLLLVLVPSAIWNPGQWSTIFPLPWFSYLVSRGVNPTRHPVSSSSFPLLIPPTSSNSFLSLLKPYL